MKKLLQWQNPYALALVLALMLTVFVWGCNCEQCCVQYRPGSEPAVNDKATYCNNHSQAVAQFVRETTDESTQRYRLGKIKDFFGSVENCKETLCVVNAINQDTSLTAFKARYDNEHAFAERDVSSPFSEEEKVELIKCGFKDAICRLENLLKE